MFSVMYTGMNFFPLWTASVWPMNSGTMVERRDHVRNHFFLVLVVHGGHLDGQVVIHERTFM